MKSAEWKIRSSIQIPIITLMLSFFCVPSFAEVYSWTDAHGHVHFSDLPSHSSKSSTYTSSSSGSFVNNPSLDSGNTVELTSIVKVNKICLRELRKEAARLKAQQLASN